MKNSKESVQNKKQPSPIEDEVMLGLEQIRNLGPHKPLGYLPIDTLSSYFHSDVQHEIERARQKGFKYLVLSPKETDIGHEGALFIYDESSLKQLLEEHRETLVKGHWPTDPEAFTRKVASVFVHDGTPLREVVDRAFGE